MKSFTIGVALLHLATLSYAAPRSAHVEARQEFGSAVTFQGAGPNPPSYTVSVPYDGSTFTIDNPLSVSHIIADDTGSGVCTFYGEDGTTTVLPGETERDVGPPQPQVSGTCIPFSSVHEPRQFFEVAITFIGAGPDQNYTQLFPTDDASHTVDSDLSVSQINSVGGGFCVFRGIDGSETVVFGEETVAVAPPQVQISGSCDIE